MRSGQGQSFDDRMAACSRPPGFDISFVRSFLIPVAAVSVAFLVRLIFLAPFVGDRGPLITFFLAVVVSVACGGFVAGLVSTLLSIFVAAYFFIQPIGAFKVYSLTEIILLGYFAMTGVVVSIMGEMLLKSRARESARLKEISAEREKLHASLASIRDAELTIRASEERLRLATSAADIGIWDLDPVTRKVACDERARRHLGLRSGAEIGVDELLESFHPDDRTRIRQAIEAALVQDLSELDAEIRVAAPGSSDHWVEVKGKAIPGRPEQARSVRLVGTVSDIAARKRAEETLKDADRRKNEFLATLAHELRNPLAPILTGLDILRQTVDEESRLRARDMMERQIGQMTRLIDDLLDISRITRGKIELKLDPLTIREVLEAAIESSRPLIQAGRHRLIVDIPKEPLIVNADVTRLVQVFSNLLNNAAKYTPDGGLITLRAKSVDGRAAVSVSDTGVGIRPEMLPRIFEMFTQSAYDVNRAQGGLGIGLTLVRSLTEMHGGTVEVESGGAGRGSRFTVYLPLCEQAEEFCVTSDRGRSSGTGSRDDLAQPSGLRILVVDDHVDAAESLSLLLKLQGHETRTLQNGTDALKLWSDYQPDLVFLDIGLPGLDGHEVARRIRSRRDVKQPVLVALTGWGGDQDRRLSKTVGFDHHLTKPVDAETLAQIINAILAEPAGAT